MKNTRTYEYLLGMSTRQIIRRILREETTPNIKVPQIVYHATFRPLLWKIKSEGLGGDSARQIWGGSKKGVVYLALDPVVAHSYAETIFGENDNIPDSWEEKIIILAINTESLDKTKFYLDMNVIDNEGDTIEYHGVIPFDVVTNIMTENDFYT